MTTDPYVYPGTKVLKNRFDIKDRSLLREREQFWVTQRATEGIPKGDFDLSHLRDIHHHLFQDVYNCAGQVRTVPLTKEGSEFIPERFIETGMADVHRRILHSGYLRQLSHASFAREAANIIGDVNYIHPFREGNGRTQLQYLNQLAIHAGHLLELSRLNPARWIEASSRANDKDYGPMANSILNALAHRERLRDAGDRKSRDDRER